MYLITHILYVLFYFIHKKRIGCDYIIYSLSWYSQIYLCIILKKNIWTFQDIKIKKKKTIKYTHPNRNW